MSTLIPDGTNPLDGSETIVMRQGGRLRRFLATVLKGQQGSPGVQGQQGPAGTPKRIEPYTATSNGSAVATITFSPAFTAPPVVIMKEGWNVNQNVSGLISNVTTTGCTVAVKRSRGTLLLTDGPFEAAPNTTVTIVAMGS